MQGMETGGEEILENIGIRGVNAGGIIWGKPSEEGRGAGEGATQRGGVDGYV